MVFTYKSFTGDRIWRTHTGDISPFWFTDLVFTISDCQCFMSPVIVQQADNYTQYIHYNIPKDWVVHNTPYGYMDRYGCMKSMIHFKTFCGANKINPRVLFYDVHESHFDNKTIHILWFNHIKPFLLKVGDSGNDQSNNNGPKLKLKGICWQEIINWQRHHGTLKFKNTHMDAILVDIWIYFQLSSTHVISNAFRGTNIAPLTPPD